jgi:hypothetical protein
VESGAKIEAYSIACRRVSLKELQMRKLSVVVTSASALMLLSPVATAQELFLNFNSGTFVTFGLDEENPEGGETTEAVAAEAELGEESEDTAETDGAVDTEAVDTEVVEAVETTGGR